MSLQHKVQFVKDLWIAGRIDAKRSGKSRWNVMKDSLDCRLNRGTSVNDYLTFGFSVLPEEYRAHYLSARENYFFTQKMNNLGFEDKWYAYERLAPFYQRDMVHLLETDPNEVEAFLHKHHNFFAKQPLSCGGEGVEHIVWDEIDSQRIAQLKAGGYYLLEESITQHPTMDKLNAYCVNTLRIVTCINKQDEVLVFPVIVRVGSDQQSVDNIGMGGFYTLVAPDGKIGLEGFYVERLDKVRANRLVEKHHPLTGLNPLGFEIPYYEETIRRVKDMARACPDFVLAGWDMAITPDGPDIVEVNNYAGIDINENYYFRDILGQEHVGAKTPLLKHLGGSFATDGSFSYMTD